MWCKTKDGKYKNRQIYYPDGNPIKNPHVDVFKYEDLNPDRLVHICFYLRLHLLQLVKEDYYESLSEEGAEEHFYSVEN